VSLLIFLPIAARSYALPAGEMVDYAVVFVAKGDLRSAKMARLEFTVAHEFMHLSGADDLYDVAQAVDWHRDSLMNVGCWSLAPGAAGLDPLSRVGAGFSSAGERAALPSAPFDVVDQRGDREGAW